MPYRNIFPENLVKVFLEQVGTVYEEEQKITYSQQQITNGTNISDLIMPGIEMKDIYNDFNGTHNITYINFTCIERNYVPKRSFRQVPNLIGVVSISILCGIALTKMGPRGNQMKGIISSLNEMVMEIVNLVMFASPIGIWSLICGELLEIDDISDTIQSLSLFILTIFLGLTIHTLASLPALYFAFTKKNPYTYFKGFFPAFLTAIGTDSR